MRSLHHGLILTGDSLHLHWIVRAERRTAQRLARLAAAGAQSERIATASIHSTAKVRPTLLRLQNVGITAIFNYPGWMHGFMSNAKLLPKAYDAIEDIAAVLKAATG
jgi:hypothetical protein